MTEETLDSMVGKDGVGDENDEMHLIMIASSGPFMLFVSMSL